MVSEAFPSPSSAPHRSSRFLLLFLLLLLASPTDGLRSAVVYFGNASLVDRSIRGGRGESRYPDDHSPNHPSNPNRHSSRVGHRVALHDIDRLPAGERPPQLVGHGLEFIDVHDGRTNLQEALERAANASRTGLQARLGVSDGDWATIRDAFTFRSAWLPQSKARLFFLHVAPAGMISRLVGPAESFVNPESDRWFPLAHADQDIHGHPIRGILRGFAPYLFHRRWSPLVLLNIWMPAQRLSCQPLVLMDTSTLDERVHRHKYHIFARDDLGARLNDCLTFTHDDASPSRQRWLSKADWGPDTAVVFDTFRTPHTSTTVPGESVAAPLWRFLAGKLVASSRGGRAYERNTADPHERNMTLCVGVDATRGSIGGVNERVVQVALEAADVTPAVRDSIRDLWAAVTSPMQSYCRGDAHGGSGSDSDGDSDHQASQRRLRALLRRTSRASVEMRAVALFLSTEGLAAAFVAISLVVATSVRRRVAASKRKRGPEKTTAG